VCEICGEDASGMDMGLSEAEMVQCQNGHIFCEDHLKDYDKKEVLISLIKKVIEEIDERNWYTKEENEIYKKEKEEELNNIDNIDEDEIEEILNEEYEFNYNVPEIICPICNFDELTDTNISIYLLKKYNINIKDLKTEMKNTFNNYYKFKEYIK
jgi:hypothetical protein